MPVRYTLLLVGNQQKAMPDMADLLSSTGFEVTFVRHFDEGRESLVDHEYDLLIMEYDGPNTPSAELITHARGLKSAQELPIFLITDCNNKDISGALYIGADDYFEAPFDQDILMAKIKQRMVHKHTWETIKLREERYSLAVEGTHDGIWDWNLDTNRVIYSDQWKNMLGIPLSENLNKPEDWFDLIHPDDLPVFKARLALHIEGLSSNLECQYRMHTTEGHYIWILCRGLGVKSSDEHTCRIAGTLTDLTNRSQHDTRTGLPFRNFFMDRLSQALAKCQLKGADHFAVLYVDIDRFKIISEGFGHNLVDELLIAFARRIERCLGKGDTLAFLGGDSFVILIRDNDGLANAREVANQIHLQLIAPFHIKDHEVFTKAIIGITKVDGETNNPEEILRQAQTAMKFARLRGSGHTEIFGKGMASQGREKLEIESKLRTALDREEFLLFYQPQVSVAQNRIVGMETLLRWRRPDGEWVSPGKFIPVAEETDLILTIGEWVLRSACQQNVKWQLAGFPPLRVAVNLSERQFRARNLVGMVDQVLAETGMDPELLELEITEGIFMEDTDTAFKILNEFRRRGIKIALDDFGTGYSSLNYLKRFPLSTLKIDRAFVTDLTHDAGDAAICSTIISLAHKFNMSVIAEGVETQEQLIILRAFQCDEIQGHFFSKALPKEEFEAIMSQDDVKAGW